LRLENLPLVYFTLAGNAITSLPFWIKMNPGRQSCNSYSEGGLKMGKKHRNRINSPKKNNHIPPEAIAAEHEAHAKDIVSAHGRKK
jgi:hypothetical protein